jgi:uncharacterized protein
MPASRAGNDRTSMEPRLHIVTLGVRDLGRAVSFYRDGLHWPMSSASVGDFAIFRLSTGTALALYPRDLLAADANVPDGGGFGCVTLAQNVPDKESVDRVLAEAVEAGGRLLKPAAMAEWGGYSGYFADPDGHPWEIAWNPFFGLEDGKLFLPE